MPAAYTKASRSAPSSRFSRRRVPEHLELARHAELCAFALEHSEERRVVHHPFVDFHIGARIVPAVHPAPAHAALTLDRGEHALDRGAKLGSARRVDLVVDVVVQTCITARSSAPPSAGATSTTVPPLKSWPG